MRFFESRTHSSGRWCNDVRQYFSNFR
jgi:hypothetical protein